jgi:hypothetical protein
MEGGKARSKERSRNPILYAFVGQETQIEVAGELIRLWVPS